MALTRSDLVRSARRLTKWTAATADLALPTSGVVVLAYHRISAAGRSQMDLHPERFRHQMEYLVDHFTVVSLDEALVLLAGRTTSVGKPPIVVTFDDGTEDFHRVALPVLDELGIAATIYVATGPVLDGTAWPDGAIALNPSALAEVASNDLVTIGCHSHDHLLLDREPAQTVANDLDRSIGLLEEWTGKRPTHFAYPKALPPSADNAALVRARFVSAALAGTRPNRYWRTDPQRLHRTPIQRDDDDRSVRHKFDGGMRLEDDLRSLVHRLTYRRATT